jgi:hypothetical protein
VVDDRVVVEVFYNGVRFCSGSFVDPEAAFAFADQAQQQWRERCGVTTGTAGASTRHIH